MKPGDRIVWRFKDKKMWNRATVTNIINNNLFELEREMHFAEDPANISMKIIVKENEIDFEILE